MTFEPLATTDAALPAVDRVAFRRAGVRDANTIAAHRQAMFRDIGYQNETALASMKARFRPWVEAKLESGDYLGWLAVSEDDIAVASVGLWLMDWPAHMVGSSTRRGNILNVYTEPFYRRRGLARVLIESALYSCKSSQIDFLILHASKEGRTLYEALGFQPGNEMRMAVEAFHELRTVYKPFTNL